MGPNIYRFGSFEVDFEQRVLLRTGQVVPLTPKAFETLAVLVSRQGKIIDKTELMKLVWPDTFVEENNLTQNISALRKAFGEGDYIETIPRRGYRFLKAAEEISPIQPEAIAEPAEPVKTGLGLRAVSLWSVLAVAVVAGALFSAGKIRLAGNPSFHADSIVVLPFVNLTADPADEYFSDGLTEEVTNSVAHLKGLRVVARTTAFQFKGKARDIRSIADQLQVNAVLEGSVRRQANRLRVTVQLNDAHSGYHIWSQTYDRDLGDLLRIQEDISDQVAHTIRPDSPPPKTAARSIDPETHNLYLLGRFQRNKTDQASVRKAMSFFEQAIEKDSSFAAAYAGLAECYVKLAQQNSMAPAEAWIPAQKAVDKALALDDNLSEAHTTQAIVYLVMDRNWEAADQQFRRAIALNPNDAAAHHWYSHYFTAMNRMNESLAESQEGVKLDPLDLQISSHLIFHYVRARDYPNAIKAGLQTLELDPHSRLAYLFLSWAYEDAGRWDQAIDALQRTSVLHPDATSLHQALQSEGPRGYWRVNREFLAKQEKPDNYRLAVCHARLGETDMAFVRLELAFQKREPELIYLKREPAFDLMENDPRFSVLTKALNLP